MRYWCAIILALLPTLAQAAGAEDNSRLLRQFDFEERRLGNVEDVPMDWAKVEGDGLPHYVSAHLSTQRHRSGEYSFQFDLNGGSLIYRYPAGHIPVQLGGHYVAEAYVQTTPLPNARARLTAYLTNADGHPLVESIRESELFATPAGDTTWHRLAIEISDNEPTAASMVIELSLLQPQMFAPPTLGKRTVFDQDIHGSAWFDDIRISQVPLVAITTDHPGNVFRHSDVMQLNVFVTDRFTDDLSARLTLRDALGRTIYQNSGAIDLNRAVFLSPSEKRMTLPLPNTLAAGWYQAALEMSSAGKFVGRQKLNLIRLADDGFGDSSLASAPDDRFGVNANLLPFTALRQLPELLPLLGVGRVKLPVWTKSGDVETGDGPGAATASAGAAANAVATVSSVESSENATAFDHLLDQLDQLRIKPTACLLDLPPRVAERLKGSGWTSLLDNDRSLWQPALAFLIARNANHLDQWQLGDDDLDTFVQNPRMREVYTLVRQEFAALVEKPNLAMPWPAWFELPTGGADSVSLHVRPEIAPQQIPLYVNDDQSSARTSGAGRNLSLFLEPLSRKAFGRDVQIRDFAQRFAYATSAGVPHIDVRLPLSVRTVGEQMMTQPEELLLISRTLMTTLGNARFEGKVPVGEGVEAFLYEKNGQGMMLLWTHAVHEGEGVADGEVQRLALNLGEHPMCEDLWGNVTPLLQAKPTGGTDQEKDGVDVQVGPMPTFLIDIDPFLAQLRASVAIDNPRLESTFQTHTRHVRFTNPYHQTISGMVRLKAPPGWTLNPATFRYSLNPGESVDQPVTMDFPLNEPAGAKTIRTTISVQAERNDEIAVPIAMTLGLEDVGLQTLALRDGTDVIVQQMISNYGEHPIDYNAFALCPGKARQERLVTSLAPGATTIKKYRFRDVDDAGEVKIRSGIKEVGGNRVLNDEVGVQ